LHSDTIWQWFACGHGHLFAPSGGGTLTPSQISLSKKQERQPSLQHGLHKEEVAIKFSGVEGIQVLCENSLLNNLLATIVTTTNRAYLDLEVRTKFLYKQSFVSNSHITIHARIITIHQLCHSA
jgi:hypothetical protein